MKGVVAAGHHITAEAGAQALREGGNAFDAAVCAVLTSCAAESTLTALGAGGFMLVHTASGEDRLYDFFVEAGGRGLDHSGRADLVAVEVLFDDVPQLFNIGPSSFGVPGTAAGIWQVAEGLCSMPFAELAKPAIRCAREGVRMTPEQAYVFTLLDPVLTHFPETRALYAPEGRMLGRRRALPLPRSRGRARAARRRGAELDLRGRDGAAHLRLGLRARRAALARGHGRIPGDRARAVRAVYRGRDVLTNPPPSSGGILIAFALDLLERSGGSPSRGSAESIALLAEVMEEANQVRAGAEFNRELHEEGCAERFLSGGHFDAALSRIGRARRRRPQARALGTDRLGSTTHISVIDCDGNARASHARTAPARECSSRARASTEQHARRGGPESARATTCTTPGCAYEHDGADDRVGRRRVELSVGSAGSNRIRSAILQMIRYVVDEGMSVHEAIHSGRIHYENGVLHAEPGFEPAALDELERRGLRGRCAGGASTCSSAAPRPPGGSGHGRALRRGRPAPRRRSRGRSLKTATKKAVDPQADRRVY